MGRVKEYVDKPCESSTMGSSPFGNWYHNGEYDYAISVTENLLLGYGVTLTNGTELTSDDFHMEDLREIYNRLCYDCTKPTYRDFNVAYGRKTHTEIPIWSKIVKSPYVASVTNYGQVFESLVCELYNKGCSEEVIHNWCNNHCVSFTECAHWIDNSIRSYEIVSSTWNTEQWTAYHINGSIDYTQSPQRDIISLFKGKSYAECVRWDMPDLYCGKQKDKWNPADILLMVNGIEDYDLIGELSEAVGSDKKNEVLRRYIEYGAVIPISLKAVDEVSAMYAHNIDDRWGCRKSTEDVKDIYLRVAKSYKENEMTGSLVMYSLTDADNGRECMVQFRSKDAVHGNLSVEAKDDKGLAHLGKGTAEIKNALGVGSGNGYYVTFTDNAQLQEALYQSGFRAEDNTAMDLTGMPDDLYQRPCFRGFFGLLNAYKETFSEETEGRSDAEIARMFGEFCWRKCVDCIGSYYILK